MFCKGRQLHYKQKFIDGNSGLLLFQIPRVLQCYHRHRWVHIANLKTSQPIFLYSTSLKVIKYFIQIIDRDSYQWYSLVKYTYLWWVTHSPLLFNFSVHMQHTFIPASKYTQLLSQPSFYRIDNYLDYWYRIKLSVDSLL